MPRIPLTPKEARDIAAFVLLWSAPAQPDAPPSPPVTPEEIDAVAKRLGVRGLEAAGVDSMALLRILLFIEAEFGFWMPDEDLVDENITSARALARYICRHRAAG